MGDSGSAKRAPPSRGRASVSGDRTQMSVMLQARMRGRRRILLSLGLGPAAVLLTLRRDAVVVHHQAKFRGALVLTAFYLVIQPDDLTKARNIFGRPVGGHPRRQPNPPRFSRRLLQISRSLGQ